MKLMNSISSIFRQKPVPADFAESSGRNNLTKALAVREKLDSSFGLSNVLPNPDNILKITGSLDSVHEEILRDAHIYGCVQSRKSGTLSLDWRISGNDEKISAFVTDCLNRLDMTDIISSILDAPMYGFQPIEIIWESDGRHFFPAECEAKPRSWFFFDNENRLCLRGRDRTPLNANKFILARHENSYDNPYGVSLLSKCYWNYFFKKNGKRFWVSFTEKYGMPWVLGKYLAGTDSGTADKMLEALTNMVQDGIVIHPDNIEIEIKASGSTVNSDMYEKLIQDCRTENTILLLGHSGAAVATPGKLGNESVALEASQRIIDSDKKLVSKTMNRFIRTICSLNFGESDYPRFSFREKEDVRKDLAERDHILSKTGVVFNKKYFCDNYNLSDEHFDIGN